MFVILEIHFSKKKVSVRFFRMFLKLFSAIILGVRNFRVFEILEHLPYIKFFLQATLVLLLKLASKIWCHFVSNLQRYDTITAPVPKRVLQFASKTSVYWSGLYIRVCNSRKIVNILMCFLLF